MAQQKNSVLVGKSRYVSGGSTEVNSTALEWWERIVFPSAEDDVPYVVDKTTKGRLDLVAALFFGEPRFWWVIAQYNNILDPHAEVVPGAIIYIPSQQNISLILNGKTGGVTSQREVPVSVLPIV